MNEREEIEALIQEAIHARSFAVAPYSKFQVGALVVMRSGKRFTGCNVEVSSYGLTICAERTAIFKSLSEGERDVHTVVVVADTTGPCFPCGACRQVLSDFAPNARIICSNIHGVYSVFSMKELLPHAFDANDLHP